jgi:hypothetical protein
MTAITKIDRLLTPSVFGAGLISKDLSTIPSAGASLEAIRRLELQLPRQLSAQHRELLQAWNGLDLDVVRIHGVPPVERGIRDVLKLQQFVPEGAGNIAFGSDPSGFVYFEGADGTVWSWDHDGGAVTQLASCVDVFIDEVVFGGRGDSFAGKEWLDQLRVLGLA